MEWEKREEGREGRERRAEDSGEERGTGEERGGEGRGEGSSVFFLPTLNNVIPFIMNLFM